MKQRLKQFYVFSMIVLFCVLAPVLVASALGYRFDHLRGKFFKTGAIVLASFPRGATIRLDGQIQAKRTPTILRNVIPGDHVVSLEAPGTVRWEKRVTVIDGRSALYDSILLAPATDQWRTERTLPAIELLANEAGDQFAWRDGTGALHIDTLTSTSPNAPITAPCQSPLRWSPFGRYLLCAEALSYHILERTPTWPARTLPLPTETLRFRWHETNESFLFAFSDTALYQIDLLALTVDKFPFSAVDAFARDQSLFTLERTGLEENKLEVVERSWPSLVRKQAWPAPDGASRFVSRDANPIAVASDSMLFVISPTQTRAQTFSEPLLSVEWSGAQNALLAWTEHELWTIPNTKEEPTLVGRFSGSINRAIWAGSWPAIISDNVNVLTFRDTDPRGGLYTGPLLSSPQGLITFYTRGGRLFAITRGAGEVIIQSVQLF